MFPIAIEAAEQTGADSKLMSYNLMLAASASFMSPFGYTTNLLIYGPGKVDIFFYVISVEIDTYLSIKRVMKLLLDNLLKREYPVYSKWYLLNVKYLILILIIIENNS